MIANYHSHTYRCHHATGTEREYIENAIRAGYRIIGFSDHAPMIFEGDYYSNYRMDFEQFEDYCATLTALREEYVDRIEVLIGLEVEYYPRHFEALRERLKGSPVEYLILGQHYTVNEYDGVRSADGHREIEHLNTYTNQLIEGIYTGAFTYVAHPDVYHHLGDRKVYKNALLRICRAAKECAIPLEINFLGLAEERTYPCVEFLDALAEVGADVVLGCDAHSAAAVFQPQIERKARDLLSSRGIVPLETVSLVNPFLKRRTL